MTSDITLVLQKIEQGDGVAAEQLFPLVYGELRRLAASKMKQERAGQTLDATSLVHEAYLRLVQPGQENQWRGRAHFFAAAAEAMRRILVDNARRKKRAKHGGDRPRVELNAEQAIAPARADELLALDEALDRLASEAPEKAKLVVLRYFGGCSLEEAASMMGISPATAKRYWSYARAWLYDAISDPAE
jgi:RNA polymerase sigma factor (TIGR02999 family)